jgi:hypothetical protein
LEDLTVTINYLRFFSEFFNRSYLIDFINKNNNKIKQKLTMSNHNTGILKEIENFSYAEFFNYIYEKMKINYKCEYIYLNEIFLNEILKNHDEEHSIITELFVNKSQADLVVINGTTTIYEIKTELDSLSRLLKQLDDYMLAFNKIYVVSYSKIVEKLTQLLVGKYENVGICVLNKDGTLTKLKESNGEINTLDKEVIFKILTRKEFERFNEDYYLAKKVFMNLSINDAHDYLRKSLLNRGKRTDYIEKLPTSLKVAGFKIQNKLNKVEKAKFYDKLNYKITEGF